MAIKEKTTISLDAQTKRDGIAILDAMGLNLSTFAEMSLRQLVRQARQSEEPSQRDPPMGRRHPHRLGDQGHRQHLARRTGLCGAA